MRRTERAVSGLWRAEVREADRNGTSLFATPSPNVLFGAMFVAGVNGVPPATARRAMSTTSSKTRRPLGNPATSPPSNPSRLGFVAGAIATLRRIISCGRPSERKVVKFGPVTSLTGMPVAKIATRSFRGAAGTLIPNTALNNCASCGLVTNCANCESPAGVEAIE